MKSLYVILIFGKYIIYIEENNKFNEIKYGEGKGNYSTVKTLGNDSFKVLNDEIPYINGNAQLDSGIVNFGYYRLFILNVIEDVYKKNKGIKEIHMIFQNGVTFETNIHIKQALEKMLGVDIFKGSFGLEELLIMTALITEKHKKTIQFAIPFFTQNTDYNTKMVHYEYSVVTGSSYLAYDEEIKNRFSKYMNIYDEEKNMLILKKMISGGIYEYLYEGKEDDIINIYQDRIFKIPFEEIKDFYLSIVIPKMKEALNINYPVYTINNKRFNELFSEYELIDKFFIEEKDILIYAKMLNDFNNDPSTAQFRAKHKRRIELFGNQAYGRKSLMFREKQMKFVKEKVKL